MFRVFETQWAHYKMIQTGEVPIRKIPPQGSVSFYKALGFAYLLLELHFDVHHGNHILILIIKNRGLPKLNGDIVFL